jgi:hypothetical protein
VEKAFEQIQKRPSTNDYFFSRLNSADWIEPLAEKGLFRTPPAAVRKGGTISFPFWAESQYLARVAHLQPELVLKTIEKVRPTDNIRVHIDFAEAALKMPPKLAARWAQQEAKWVAKQDHLYFLLPEKLADLVQHLAAGGQTAAAFGLAGALLSLRPTERNTERSRALFDEWNYREILRKQYTNVVRSAGLPALVLLCDLLCEALRHETEEPGVPDDHSWVWRPAIEDDEQNFGRTDLRDSLIEAIRDSAMVLVKNQSTTLEDVLDLLRKFPGVIFQRLEIYLATVFAEQYPQIARKFVLSRDKFERFQLHHEYQHLLKTQFPLLPENDRNTILKWVESGPEQRSLEADPGRQRIEVVAWQIRKLSPLSGMLPSDWQARYEQMVREFGQPEHPEFFQYITTWTGPVSPKSRKDLRGMTIDELAKFLKEWAPTSDWGAPSMEGLGRELQALVGERPDVVRGQFALFRGVDATYARYLIQGLDDALRADKAIEWSEVLDYANWIVAQPRPPSASEQVYRDRDPHWGWARKAVLRLLGTGLERSLLPVNLRCRVWSVINPLTGDPDPSAREDSESTMDAASRSINTTRGEALHATVRYSLWVHRCCLHRSKEDRKTFDDMPEVRQVLEQHLDPAHEKSPAVRAVYGQWIPWLFLLGENWVRHHLKMIFPETDMQLRLAAWNTYITMCPAYDEVFEALRSEYTWAIERIGVSSTDAHRLASPEERLAEHLMLMAGRGKLGPGLSEELARFFDRASDELAGHAISFAGRALGGDEEIPAEVLGRMRQLWEELLASAQTSGKPGAAALKGFGWWFASMKFPLKWSAEQLLQVLKLSREVEADFRILERLVPVAKEDPITALQVLQAIVRYEQKGWGVVGWKAETREILEATLRDPRTAEQAELLIHELGAKGIYEFRSLLRAGAKGKETTRLHSG